ncbi:MAG: undecaprenyldiphospho-muramoylpentapeptide beta-N-acetylglucosaminyltransferase [Deltaproteobacteria bacterium]|nr:undecaprenyldiphospho-muramoylpentapeptide beta-N-acetylglucosaminyltransferase [Deltaproteobacteria bacterium]
MKPHRVAVVGDGTAGHVYPTLAIADAYRQSCEAADLLFIGIPESFAARLAPLHGYRLALVQGGPLFGVGLAGKLSTLWRLGIGIQQARQILRTAHLKLVIGVGGYASAAAVLAAKSLGLATAIYEANTVPGLTNRLLGHTVDRVYLGSAAARWAFPAGRTLVTGNPLRARILSAGSEKRIPPHGTDRPIHILVTGGSLGAPFLNRKVPELLKQVAIRGLALEVQHQVGGTDPAQTHQAYVHARIPAVVVSYLDDIAEAYRWADFAITRAGAGTVAELAAFGLPALLVPLPHAPGNHQISNALAFVDAGGAWCVQEKDWHLEALTEQLARIFTDAATWTTISQRARQFATPNAAHAIVADCETLMIGRW